jgi:hypothetical protein
MASGDKLAQALLRAFMTCESADGQYRVVLEYATLEDAQDAHQTICEALAAHDAETGFVLVPKEPTEVMRRAGNAAYWASQPLTGTSRYADDDAGVIYRAMIAAAPKETP